MGAGHGPRWRSSNVDLEASGLIACVGSVRLTKSCWLRSLRSLRATARNRDASFTALAKAASAAPDAVDFQ